MDVEIGAGTMTDDGEDTLFPQYIPRDEESDVLAAVTRVSKTGRSEALLLYGPGGVGKTRLVRALAERQAEGPVRWLQPVDLDDPEYWLLTNLQANIARQLDPEGEYFRRYAEHLARPPRQSREHVTPEALVSHLGQVRRIFVECYTDYVAGTGKPVAIVFDTVEAIRGMGLLMTLTREWMPELPRTLFILSGRPVSGADAGDPIREYLAEPRQLLPVSSVVLGAFSRSTAEKYLADSGVAVGLADEEREKLVLLTRGHPLWLACTVAYLSERGLPDEAQTELSVIEQDLPFEGPMSVRGRQLHLEFQRRVLSVYRDADFWHETVLRLAAVRQSVNEDIWRQLMADRALPEPEPGGPSLWDLLLRQPWIRPRANGRYVTLHDAVAEELAKSVILAHDEDGQWRLGQWRRAAAIFRALTEDEEQRLSVDFRKLDSRRLLASEPEPITTEAARIGEGKRELDQWKASCFFYELLSGFDVGCRYFLDLFEQAGHEQDLLLQDLLTTVMLRCLGVGDGMLATDDATSSALSDFRAWLADGQQALHRELAIALAGFLVSTGQAPTAVTLLRDFPLEGADAQQMSNQKILLANAYLRIPREVRKGLQYLQQAKSVADNADLAPSVRYRLAARAYKEQGYYYRNLGQLNEAEKAYEHGRDAIEVVLAIESTSRDRLEKASIQSNWAYVKGLNGYHDAGLLLVESAIKVRREFNPGLAVGISLSIKGEVLRYKQKFKQAWTAYAQAVEIFTQAQDQSWLGIIYQEQAICLYQAYHDDRTSLATGDPLDEARDLADRAVSICRERSVRNYPSALNRAARIIGDEDADRGLELLAEGVIAARTMSDGWFWLANLIEYAELSYRAWLATGDYRYRDGILRFESDFSEAVSDYEFPDLRGRWEVVAGHLRVHDWADTGDDRLLSSALQYYADGFLHIGERPHVGSSGATLIEGKFKTFASLFAGLPGHVRLEWVDHLRREWSGSQPGSDMLLALLEGLY
jgi:tetratricopeptide (TPR) repeat protein